MKSPNTKSSDQLKAEIHQDLKKVERSIDQLQRRLTPGQILDDVVFYPRGKSLKGTVQHLRDNPVGTTFLSLGTILLMEDNSQHTLEWTAKQKLHSAQDIARNNVRNVKEAIQRKFPEERREDLKVKAKEKIQEIKESIESKTSQIKDEVQVPTDKLGPLEQNFSFETETKLGRVKDRAKEMFQSGREKIREMDSLSFLALGAGLGVVTGSSLPIPDQEKEFIHQKLGERLGHLGDDLEAAINQSSNILKDLVIKDLKDYDLRIFKD